MFRASGSRVWLGGVAFHHCNRPGAAIWPRRSRGAHSSLYDVNEERESAAFPRISSPKRTAAITYVLAAQELRAKSGVAQLYGR